MSGTKKSTNPKPGLVYCAFCGMPDHDGDGDFHESQYGHRPMYRFDGSRFDPTNRDLQEEDR